MENGTWKISPISFTNWKIIYLFNFSHLHSRSLHESCTLSDATMQGGEKLSFFFFSYEKLRKWFIFTIIEWKILLFHSIIFNLKRASSVRWTQICNENDLNIIICDATSYVEALVAIPMENIHKIREMKSFCDSSSLQLKEICISFGCATLIIVEDSTFFTLQLGNWFEMQSKVFCCCCNESQRRRVLLLFQDPWIMLQCELRCNFKVSRLGVHLHWTTTNCRKRGTTFSLFKYNKRWNVDSSICKLLQIGI